MHYSELGSCQLLPMYEIQPERGHGRDEMQSKAAVEFRPGSEDGMQEMRKEAAGHPKICNNLIDKHS